MFPLITRAEHERILAAYVRSADAEIARINAELGEAEARWRRANSRNAANVGRAEEAMRERDEARATVAAQDAILDAAYVRNAKGQIERYRASKVAA